jgi:alkanesulfonate monooxygenase SsuD/methylene tetrahydromethanopterin reductase-like flavin-dependent oxidoreductase (luciferase family)
MSGLGDDFSTRGKRIEEQVDVLRLLWSQRLVEFEGKYHKLDDVGLMPMPIQQPIPVWFGGGADVVLRRIARMADGWIPNGMPLEQAQELVSKLNRYMEAEGRDMANFGIDVRVNSARHSAAEQLEHYKAWRGWGATHFALDTMRAGYDTLQKHLDAAQDFITRMKDA